MHTDFTRYVVGNPIYVATSAKTLLRQCHAYGPWPGKAVGLFLQPEPARGLPHRTTFDSVFMYSSHYHRFVHTCPNHLNLLKYVVNNTEMSKKYNSGLTHSASSSVPAQNSTIPLATRPTPE